MTLHHHDHDRAPHAASTEWCRSCAAIGLHPRNFDMIAEVIRTPVCRSVTVTPPGGPAPFTAKPRYHAGAGDMWHVWPTGSDHAWAELTGSDAEQHALLIALLLNGYWAEQEG